ncbi:peptide deformylase [Eisenibacter elegans]|jgi:peptide deformylase|uniref:peptide deformylase n=1 Tax=Eisenibacter elegans TaxID=997 RepID=UPI0003FBEF5E|nr:peptide deformylase [Eisenibacter elegans]
MIYPIVAYGDPVLKKVAQDIDPKDASFDLKQLVADMFETMYNAQGVGLAAPQIGKSLRLFVVDAEPMDEENLKGFKKVFVNPEILEETGTPWAYEEGCLSIPTIRGDVERPEKLRIRYYDENWNAYEEEYHGMAARVIQHEYDHIEGILFTEHLPALKRRLLKSKLGNISKGKVRVDYRMRFPNL